jgi:alpha-D-xyloside xylohydrolase
VYAGKDGSFTLYEDEGVNYNYEKGSYATIPFTYNDADKTVEIGERKDTFKGMLKERRFNIVYVDKENPAAIKGDATDTLIDYAGTAVKIALRY